MASLSITRWMSWVRGSKQQRGAVPLAVMGHTLKVAQSHGKHRLGALQRLNPALFLDT